MEPTRWNALAATEGAGTDPSGGVGTLPVGRSRTGGRPSVSRPTPAGWHGTSIANLDPAIVGSPSCGTGIGTDLAEAEADLSGTLARRIRFHVVNEPRYASFTPPTDGNLLGFERPTGYPNGTASHERGLSP
jgi:hypothetical protein